MYVTPQNVWTELSKANMGVWIGGRFINGKNKNPGE